MLNFREILYYERLGQRRRGAGRVEAWVAVGLIVAGAAAGFGGRELVDAGELGSWWRAGLALAAAIVVMGEPFRLFWRSESTLLARLPIAGETLYALGTWRAGRFAAGAACALLPAAAAISLPAIGLAAAVLAAAVLLAPAMASFAGHIIASEKAQIMVRELAGGQTAPSVIWLSLLPATGGLAAAWVAWLGDWSSVGILAGVAVVAFGAGLQVARRSLSDAMREVAAMDAVRYAHVELSGPGRLEELWGRLTGAGRLVYTKDISLLRRRFVLYYIICGLIILTMWIATFAAAEPVRWAVTGAIALVVYTLWTSRRLHAPPIEHPRLLTTLPIDPSSASRAKSLYIVLRLIWSVALGLAPLGVTLLVRK